MILKLNHIICGNTLSILRQMESESVHCIVTSPPYFALRNYGMPEQIGLENTPALYVAVLVEIFKEAKRVLRNDGTLWLNIGDSYAAPGKNKTVSGLKPKDLIGIPWMLAFALRADGWYLRCDIIWNKPNPMPESITDRPTKAHEYIFLLSKSTQYYYDAEAIKTSPKYICLKGQDQSNFKDARNYSGKHSNKQRGHSRSHAGFNERWDNLSKKEQSEKGANKRSVWSVATHPYVGAHFATFPPKLITDCIKAGCPVGGVVLDPFIGAGTTAVVCNGLNRNWLGIELNPDYVKLAQERINKALLKNMLS